VADELDRPREEVERHEEEPHLPSPTIWPFAFAAGVALVLIGLIVSWIVAAVGAVLAIVFGALWIRDATRGVRAAPAPAEVETADVDPLAAEDEPARYPRSKFLEGATIGIGAMIGAVITLPVVGFAIGPAFIDQGYNDVDLGPLDNFPTGQFMITTFYSKGDEYGDVGLRTAYIRNNGVVDQVPSFTILSSRCVHLGCPVQPQGPTSDEERKSVEAEGGQVVLTPTQPSGFGCPCHGGAYNTEGERVAGPPVRSLDRYSYAIIDGNLVLKEPYSVGEVEGTGADAEIHAYKLADPGQHVDGPEQIFYPIID
jgi:quinol---cytochrome c reductase iron-sulfur subunit, bacillus type